MTLEEPTKACNMAGDGAEEVLQSLIDTLELCVGKIKGKVVQTKMQTLSACFSTTGDSDLPYLFD